MELAVDVVSREGRAAGGERPLWLVLDKDVHTDVRAKCTGLLGEMCRWEEVAPALEFECEPLWDS